jgi:recombinational DNA repair ATPase RecF
LVEHTEDAYYQAFKKLVDNELLRFSIQRRGYLDVSKYSIDRGYRKWLSAYNQILRS